MNKNYLIVLNPKLNKDKKIWLSWVTKQLKQRNIPYYIYTTGITLSQNQLFFTNNLAKYTHVVSLGGDGTLHMLANCLAYSNKPLIILPCGTGNDFARNFAYTRAQYQALVFSDESRTIDLGKINSRFFINVAGVGFDAKVANQLASGKGGLGKLSYLLATVASLMSYKGSSLVIQSNNQEQRYRNFMTLFAKGGYFGAGFLVNPDANLSDGFLSVSTFRNVNIASKLLGFLYLLLKKHSRINALTQFKTPSLEIKTEGLLIEADGEIIGHTPAQISVAKNALMLATIKE
jgi:diacylglycerol kinase (ATP)